MFLSYQQQQQQIWFAAIIYDNGGEVVLSDPPNKPIQLLHHSINPWTIYRYCFTWHTLTSFIPSH